jgi:hypothetical protein
VAWRGLGLPLHILVDRTALVIGGVVCHHRTQRLERSLRREWKVKSTKFPI